MEGSASPVPTSAMPSSAAAVSIASASAVVVMTAIWFALNGTMTVRGQERGSPSYTVHSSPPTNDPCSKAKKRCNEVAFLGVRRDELGAQFGPLD